MPNFFETVIRNHDKFSSTERVSDLELLEPKTRELIGSIIRDAAAQNLKLTVRETYRSQVRQTELFRRGKSDLKTVGVHHYGIACDLVKVVDGQPSWDGDFSLLGQLAKQYGLIWGGDWGKPNVRPERFDPVHVQRCTVARQTALFAGSWYPDDAYDPYDD